HAGGAAGLAHHAAMARDRARAIAAAVQVDEHARDVAAGDDRPFAGDAVEIDRLELYVLGNRPDRADLVEALAALGPAHRPRLGAEQHAYGIDLTLGHCVTV